MLMITEDRKTTHACGLGKHAVENHERRMDVKYSIKVVKDFKDPLTKQVNEAFRMTMCEANITLNSKSEWHGPAIVRLVPDG